MPLLLACLALLPALPAGAQTPPRALVADFVNVSKDRHAVLARTATDAVALELIRRGVYAIIARTEVERTAKERNLHAPYSEDNLRDLAKALEAPFIVTGEIHHAEQHIRDKQREWEVGMIVRVYAPSLGEIINGAAERGIIQEPADGSKTEGVLLMEAAASAASRCVARIAAYRPIVGTILNTGVTGGGVIIMNRGAGHGVKPKQEFIVLRDGIRVARLRTGRISPNDCELSILENFGGVRPEDKAVAVFPEPKFGR